MKRRTISFLFSLLIFVSGCSSDKQSDEGLVSIDVLKDYPEKEIILTDIADINYIHLNTKNKDYRYEGEINYVSKNTIVINDIISGSILFFSKDGTPKSSFNHYGNGPKEYSFRGWSKYKSISQLLYDEKADEVFIYNNQNFIRVYNSTGKYLRTIKLPQDRVYCFNFFDNQTLIVYFARFFFLISRTNGKVIEYIEIPFGDADTSMKNIDKRGYHYTSVMMGHRIIKCKEGYYLCNPESDTVFLYNKNKNLTPAIFKTPLMNDLDPMIALDNCWDVGKYQFLRLHTRHLSNETENPEYPDRYYIRDKKTGEVFRQKIILPDYRGKELCIFPVSDRDFHEKSNLIHFELDLAELKEAYRENKLSGKLKTLVASLDEHKDNNVFMFVEFK